jgi:serine/threonine protein phosphatase PrpC
MLQAYGISDKGRVRPTNEDCFAADEALRLCVVADGMGGHNAGEVAARIAVDAVVELVREGAGGWPFGVDPELSDAGNLLRTAIYLANARILETAVGDEQYEGMGTTIVAALVAGGRLSVGHVGDSRFYLFANGRLRQLTHDDSWVATVLAHDPDVDPSVLEQHPMRNALTNVVGTRSHTEVHIVEETLQGAELLLLTTDGIHGVLDDLRLEQLLGEGHDPRQTAAAILDAALTCGSRDNCTAIVARYRPD